MSGRLWFTSDWHIGHHNIIEFCERPFANLEEMHAGLIQRYNERVAPGDEVWFLGDIGFYMRHVIADVINVLHGNKHVVFGNHDKKNRAFMSPLFRSAQDYKELKWDKHKFILSHYPFHSWNGSGHGHNIMLHGHTHANLPFNPELRRLDVGVDGHAYEPWNAEDILELMNTDKKCSFKYK